MNRLFVPFTYASCPRTTIRPIEGSLVVSRNARSRPTDTWGGDAFERHASPEAAAVADEAVLDACPERGLRCLAHVRRRMTPLPEAGR
jgi:hypothetical protein